MNEREKAAAFDRIVAARETGDMDSTFAAVEREIDVLPRLEDIFPTQLDGRPISGHPFEVQRDGIYPNVCIVCGEVADHPNHQLDVSAVSGDRLRELLHEWVHGAGIPSDIDEAVRRVREATEGDR